MIRSPPLIMLLENKSFTIRLLKKAYEKGRLELRDQQELPRVAPQIISLGSRPRLSR